MSTYASIKEASVSLMKKKNQEYMIEKDNNYKST